MSLEICLQVVIENEVNENAHPITEALLFLYKKPVKCDVNWIEKIVELTKDFVPAKLKKENSLCCTSARAIGKMSMSIHQKYVNFLVHQIFAQEDFDDNREGYCNAKSMLF